ncbi:MAG: Deoxyuridine 5'-triphosphate nucleotidohydrolase [Chlamydiae bacterium]|nr:Deoxyuridine 5'-triphosphate nucleotidohydrolase [Chlamydiota bacterium]
MDQEVPTVVEEGADLPFYATEEASGADVRAHIQEELTIEVGETKLIPTGLRFEIPSGFEIQVRPRSGLALKHGLTVLNTPGTIDSDYRGELQIILINHGKAPFTLLPNMRIAQIVFSPVARAHFYKKSSLSTTARGERGFGHTGSH